MPRKTNEFRHQIHQSLPQRTRRIDADLSTAESQDLNGRQLAGAGLTLSRILIRRRRMLVLVSFGDPMEVAVELPAFHVFGQGIDAVERQAKGLADITDGTPCAVSNDDGRHPGSLAPVFAVDILQHLLASLVLEIDVDIRRLIPLLADEPLEQHFISLRIDAR